MLSCMEYKDLNREDENFFRFLRHFEVHAIYWAIIVLLIKLLS